MKKEELQKGVAYCNYHIKSIKSYIKRLQNQKANINHLISNAKDDIAKMKNKKNSIKTQIKQI